MADQSIERAERVSALVDGQLQGNEFVQALADLETSSDARANWDTYHLLGDVMRSGEHKVRAHDPDFVLHLRQRMAQEAIEIIAVPAVEMASETQKPLRSFSANNGNWLRIAGFATVALAGVLAWQGLHWASAIDPSVAPQLAQRAAGTSVPSVSTVVIGQENAMASGAALIRADGSSALAMTSESPVMIRDPQLDALLAAHRQFGGTSALQMPAGFLRNAAFAEGRR